MSANEVKQVDGESPSVESSTARVRTKSDQLKYYEARARRVEKILLKQLTVEVEYVPAADNEQQHHVGGIEKAVEKIMADFGLAKPRR